MNLFYVPFVLQAGLMLVDEFYCHQRRELPLWERVGHPLDTLSMLICIGMCVLLAPTASNLQWYLIAAVISSLLITKDEFIHKTVCTSLEHWLHSLLFVIHPTCLIAAGYLWSEHGHDTFFRFQSYLTLAFLSYQVLAGAVFARNTFGTNQQRNI